MRRVSSRALRAAWRARERPIALLMICRASVGFSSRNCASFWLTVVLDEALDPRVAELRLRLPLELRVAELHRDDRGEPLADVLALEVVLLLLEQPLSRAYLFSVPVSAERKPERCEPPSCVLMLFANEKTDSTYELFHCIATST